MRQPATRAAERADVPGITVVKGAVASHLFRWDEPRSSVQRKHGEVEMSSAMRAAVAFLAFAAAGCSTTDLDPSATASGSPTATPAPTPAGTALSLVGLGDSIPGAGDADASDGRCADCVSYVARYGELAAAALGRPVTTTNLATDDGVGARQLLDRVRTLDEYRAPIATADLITLTIGTNDWQGPCEWPGDDDCWRAGATSVPADIDAILTEIETMLAGRPAVIRVTTYFDNFIGYPENLTSAGDPNGGMPQEFLDFYRAALETFNASICEVARRHDAVCIDLHTPFNGAGHDQPASDLLLPDHIHPNQAGHDLIARTIADAGFAPLR